MDNELHTVDDGRPVTDLRIDFANWTGVDDADANACVNFLPFVFAFCVLFVPLSIGEARIS